MSFGETLSSLGTSITSPAKIAFIGYVVLAYTGKICTSKWEFIVFAFVFFVAQVLHDDYARILLNRRAELQAKKAHRKAFGDS
jgi:hypothetical protein